MLPPTITPFSSVAVSYTHLDVYKRQELTEIILDAESVEFYCENMEMAIEEIQMKMES